MSIENEYVFKCGGKELAKVLFYYGFIEDTSQSEYKIVCPFHDDVNPSMLCNLSDGSYYCFGCGETGDALKFVRKMSKSGDDLKSLIEYFRVLKSDKCKSVSVRKVARKKKDDKHSLIVAGDYYYGLRKVNWKVDEQEEVLQASEYLEKRGFSKNTLTKIGAKVTYNSQYPIIFPMKDNGVFKGWVCRTTSKEIEKKRKYLYNEGFSRATTLVGMYGKKNYVYVVEGYMDMLKMRQNGVHNVVAILGWKMSSEQIEKLRKAGVKNIVSALDNDECGKKGTEFLRRHFSVIRFCYKKGFKDPGEMNKKDFEVMNNKTVEKIRSKGWIGSR